MIKTRKTSLTKYLPLTLLQGFEKVVQGFRVRGSWRLNRNFNILTSSLMAVNVVSFSFFWCSTRGLGVHSVGCWLSLRILSASSLDPNSSGSQALSAWCGFPYHISSTPTVCNSTGICLLSWFRYIIIQRPHDRPLDLWNWMFNHQAEITVMQFTGHSLQHSLMNSYTWMQ